jgi:hypothetical protein
MCPSLDRLELIHRNACRLRDSCHRDKDAFKANARGELDVLHIQKLISHHRSTCRSCRLNEPLRDLPKYFDRYSMAIPISQLIH